MTVAAVVTAVASLLTLLSRKDKQDADILFAVVSGSLAISLMSPWMVGAPAWLTWAVAIGGSSTCNGFWLVSRALFRGAPAVQLRHVGLAVSVALLIAIHRGSAMHAEATSTALLVVNDALLTFMSTSLLALSFLEPLRGWSSQWTRSERRFRLSFLALYGASVLSTTLLGALADAYPALQPAHRGVVALCASSMLVFTHFALRYRRRSPLPSTSRRGLSSEQAKTAPCEDDARLTALLQHNLNVLQVYREPDLRVAELAARLGTVEHRLSKLITQRMGEKNFNQLLNRYRIAHACRLLAMREGHGNILRVSTESGFASLGPFNRAFKTRVGCTPSAYRARCLEGGLRDPGGSDFAQLRLD
ncbi:helix-turn-helix transcriptional regulator [Dokdonella sp.]|uniref:helix-turn-helix domain-containing protein n=1 Tax=Dokdonella sp. TaxID=2291710 RepID=UPI002F406076